MHCVLLCLEWRNCIVADEKNSVKKEDNILPLGEMLYGVNNYLSGSYLREELWV
jgi:hypothetical protein